MISLAVKFLNDYEEPFFVEVDAVHYFPPNYRVEEYYVNGHYYGNSGFDGRPGSGVCCVWLPERWKPGLMVDVSWAVSDWTLTPIDDKSHFDRTKIRDVGMYRARVPVEKYQEPGNLYIHFFDGGRVRVSPGILRFASQYATKSELEAVAKIATQGRSVTELLTPEDRAMLAKEVAERRKKYGDWR
jgi:hypothetical protein